MFDALYWPERRNSSSDWWNTGAQSALRIEPVLPVWTSGKSEHRNNENSTENLELSKTHVSNWMDNGATLFTWIEFFRLEFKLFRWGWNCKTLRLAWHLADLMRYRKFRHAFHSFPQTNNFFAGLTGACFAKLSGWMVQIFSGVNTVYCWPERRGPVCQQTTCWKAL